MILTIQSEVRTGKKDLKGVCGRVGERVRDYEGVCLHTCQRELPQNTLEASEV